MADIHGLSVEDRLRLGSRTADQIASSPRSTAAASTPATSGYGRLFAADGSGWADRLRQDPGRDHGDAERAAARQYVRPGPQSAWHLVTEPAIVLDGDRATGSVTWTGWAAATRRTGDAAARPLPGHLRARARPWRFQRHRPHRHPAPRTRLARGWAAGRGGLRAAASPPRGDRGCGGPPAPLEDLEQISRLFIEYKAVLDRQDFAAYASLFAENGEFVAGPGVAKGRAAIREMVEAMPSSGLLGAAWCSARTTT